MILARVHANRMFTLRDVSLDPEPGLTVFVGKNGAGKTALGLESIAWGVWGQTIRGTSPDTAEVSVSTTYHRVKRTRIKKKTELIFENLEDDLTGQTPTETQRRIDAVFGSFDQFCSTRVFSSRLLTRFGSATDKDRKALLEEILGLGRFEEAAKVARALLGDAKVALAGAESRAAAAVSGLEQAKAAETSLKASPGRTAASVQADLARAAKKVSEALGAREKVAPLLVAAMKDLKDAQEAHAAARRAVGNAETYIASLEHSLKEAACSQCKRPFPPKEGREGVERTIAEAKANLPALRAAVDPAATNEGHKQTKVNFINGKIAALDQLLGPAQGDVRAFTAELKGAESRDAQIDAAAERVDAAEMAVQDARALVHKHGDEVLLATEAAAVLGPKGVRSRLLEGALAELQIAVNELLPRMGGHAKSLSISSTKMRASGEEVAEVSIQVEGAGDGDYKGLSDGERVRVDVAILLGLARLSKDQGLLILDEVFDPLDDEGLEGAAEILGEMARERQIFLITHNPRFLGLMPTARVVRVARDANGASKAASGQ